MAAMSQAASRAAIHTSGRSLTSRRPPGAGVEYEFEKLTLSRDLSRSSVTRMLVDRAEHGGWELDRLRLTPDGTRRVVLRRKIIRARPTY